jgi:DNA processing protein
MSRHGADDDTLAWLHVSLVPGVGGARLRRLLREFGAPAQILAARAAQLEPLVGRDAAVALERGPDPALLQTSLDWLCQPGNWLVTLSDADYPAQLLQTVDPPAVLYVTGQLPLLNRPALAIVGSRSPTPAGVANAEAFAEALGQAGLTIVSGLALGIDAAAHRGALRTVASSIAVCGTGLDRVYPARNRGLARQLAEQGALVSEFPLGTPPTPPNFPRRNRIISGLSRGCLVVEAAMHSGSLITARQALEQDREVFAMPGSIHSPLSKGCHWLIKQGAKLVESAQDVLDELGMPHAGGEQAVTIPPALSREQRQVLDAMSYEPVDLDLICQASGLTADVASAMLLALELDGTISRLPGGLYQRLR